LGGSFIGTALREDLYAVIRPLCPGFLAARYILPVSIIWGQKLMINGKTGWLAGKILNERILKNGQ